FEKNSASDEHGEFLVEDLTSGSSGNKYGDLSVILDKQHTGQGMFFQTNNSSSISKEYVATAKTQFFENFNNDNFIQVLDKDDEYFGKRARPIRYFFAIEKSMYQSINDEMIDLFASLSGLQSYANVIGEPVNKYRRDYKKLNFIRRLFFNKITNTPDLEKYLEFYKWFDDSISAMILNLIPASSDFEGVQNVVESHILERNKYRHKFPTVESELPEFSGTVEGINQLKYNWKFGHAPLTPDGGEDESNAPGNQNQNTLWWKHRAERNNHAPNNFNSLPFDKPATARITTTGGPLNDETFTLTDAAGLAVGFIFKHGVTTVDGTKDGDNVIIGVNGALGSAPSVGERIRDAINASDAAITAVEETGPLRITLTQQSHGTSGNTTIDMSGVTTVTATNFAGAVDSGGVSNTRGFIH
ncbi:MAG TPA: hypothetical protein DCM40_31505, partial [Maribacter sp.]|nr:hypothetical protein [Maribacter sp.]